MTKRIIALFLALILTVGLLPTVALAAEGDETEGGQTASSTKTDTKYSGADSEQNADNPVHIVKSATTDADGKGTLKLEAYVTDPMTITTHDVPLDIVLVLDQSGSMGFCINCKTEYNSGSWSGDKTCTTYGTAGKAGTLTSGDDLYVYLTGRHAGYYKVEYCDGSSYAHQRHQAGWYLSYDYGHESRNRLSDSTDLYQKTTKDHVHRLDTLKQVLESFTGNVEKRATDAKVAHRIAMVGFASDSNNYNNTEILTGVDLKNGSKSFGATAYYYPTTEKINGVQKSNAKKDDYKNALVDVSQPTGQKSVTAAINALTAQGGTQTDDGLDMAAEIFKNNPLTGENEGRKRIVILFTDGEVDNGHKRAAENKAKELKEDYNATVYTVGLFAGADQTSTNGNNGFLQDISSNNGTAPREGEKSYYLAANDAISLQKVFEQITEEVNKLMLDVGTSSVLSDTLSERFDFDIPADGNLSSAVKFTLVPVAGKNDDGTFTWNEAGARTITGPELKKGDGKSFTVTNFDYGANKITRVYNASGEITGYTGNKLVIEIPIKADTTKTTGWTAGKTDYPTNSSTGGAKLSYKDEKGNDRSTTVDSPKAPVTGYIVTYDYGTDSETPTGVTMPTDSKVYIKDQTYTAQDGLTAEGYSFAGWFDNAACTGDKVTSGNITGNVTLYGKFTKNTFTVTYTDGVNGTAFTDQTTPNVAYGGTIPAFNGTPTREGYSFNGWTSSVEGVTPSGTMPASNVTFTATWTEKNKATISYEVVGPIGCGSVSPANEQKYVDDLTDATGSTATANDGYTFVGWYAEEACSTLLSTNARYVPTTPSEKWENATYYAKFTQTQYQPTELNLTGRFWKLFYSNTKLDGTQTFTIEVKRGDTVVATAEATVSTTSGDFGAWKYCGSNPFATADNDDFILSFNTTGTYEYTVTEVDGNVSGITYDSTEYHMTVGVTADNENMLHVSSVTIQKNGENITDGERIIFRNYYNAATIDFSQMIQKQLTATGDKTVNDVTFEVSVEGDCASRPQSTGPEENVPEPEYKLTLRTTFDSVTGGNTYTQPFYGSITVDRAGQYYFTIKEIADTTRTSIDYDSTEYMLSVTVQDDGGKLYVSYWDYAEIIEGARPVYITGSEDNKLTFHNTIDTGRDDYIPIIIPTIINKDTGMLNKTDHFAYVIGYPDGTVHPNGQITRAEVATIFFRLLKDEVRDGAFTTSNSYSDVAYGKWYNNPISTMSALGIITGYPDGTFKPDKPITRAEFAAIAARFDETQYGKSATFSDVIGHWAANEIGIAYANEWIKGYPDGTFKPDQNITRAEAMTMINRVLERKPESPSDLLTDMNKWTDNMDTSKWYYLDVQEATNSHAYTRKTFNYELWRQMLTDPDWSRYER